MPFLPQSSLYPGLGQAPNMLACIPSGVVLGISGTGLLWAAYPSCHPTNNEGSRKQWFVLVFLRPSQDPDGVGVAPFLPSLQCHYQLSEEVFAMQMFVTWLLHISDIAIFVLKRDVKLQPTNQRGCYTLKHLRTYKVIFPHVLKMK